MYMCVYIGGYPGARDARRVTDRDYSSSIGGAVLRGALRGLYLLLDICRALRFPSELSVLRSPASASFLPSTLRVASRRSVMPLLDLISLSFSSSTCFSLFLSFFLFVFSFPFFPFFLSLTLSSRASDFFFSLPFVSSLSASSPSLPCFPPEISRCIRYTISSSLAAFSHLRPWG